MHIINKGAKVNVRQSASVLPTGFRVRKTNQLAATKRSDDTIIERISMARTHLEDDVAGDSAPRDQTVLSIDRNLYHRYNRAQKGITITIVRGGELKE